MIPNDSSRNSGPRDQLNVSGWTSLHSWIFLAIVILAVLVMGFQNRYHYLSPLGLGKAYRIDKLFGGIQEYRSFQRLDCGPTSTHSATYVHVGSTP